MADFLEEEQVRRQKVRDALGPALCLAKWNQVTIHLGTGLNHSCHHPGAHKINEKEVMRNPAALHNTMYKKRCWKQMLDGIRPAECDYCWKVEDNSPLYSDRVFKSSEPWAWPTLEEIKNSDWLEDHNPRYVELSFSNRCNFKCLYCSPQFSSRWQAEAKKYGPIMCLGGYKMDAPISEQDEYRCLHVSENPLTQAFWKWWPELFRTLHTFRLTGGEPLLVDECYQVLEYIQEHWEENPNISLGLNTNLGMSDEQFERFMTIMDDLSNNGKVRELVIYTSIESAGKQAEYVRFGLNTEKFWYRVEELVKRLPKLTLTIMSTYNILSIDTFDEVIDKVYDLKVKYHGNNGENRIYGTAVMLDTTFIRWPDMLSPKLATPEQREKIRLSGEKVESLRAVATENEWPAGFCEIEIEKIKRIYDYVQNDKEPFDVNLKYRQLRQLLKEVDRRRGTNYREVFGEI